MEKQFESSWSGKQLLIIFFVSLLIFSAYRYDASAWVKTQFDTAIAQNKLQMTYNTIELSGFHVELKDVHVRIASLPKELVFDEVVISPDWLAGFGLRWAGIIELRNAFMGVSASVSMHGEQLEVYDLSGQVDVAETQTWLSYPLPAQVSGKALLKGDIVVNSHSTLPLSGQLSVTWQDASLGIMQQTHRLGDYRLAMTFTSALFRWILQGGNAVTVKGKGEVTRIVSPIQTWPLQGDIDIQIAPQSTVSHVWPKKYQHIKLGGVLGMPTWMLTM